MGQISQRSEGVRKSGRKRKIILYGLGVLFLTAALAAAFFLPECYSHWQDRQLLNQPQVTEREQVHLPEAHDRIAGKIQALCERDSSFFLTEDFQISEKTDAELTLAVYAREQLTECVKEWIDFGLLPEVFLEEYEQYEMREMRLYTAEGSPGCSIYWLQLMARENNAVMDFLMDIDGSCLYYASFAADPERTENQDRWYTDGTAVWQNWTEEDMQEGGSFRAREYCQAEYSRLGFHVGNEAGFLELYYDEFCAEAVRCNMMVYFDTVRSDNMTVKNVYWNGFAVTMGSTALMDLIMTANLSETGCFYYYVLPR